MFPYLNPFDILSDWCHSMSSVGWGRGGGGERLCVCVFVCECVFESVCARVSVCVCVLCECVCGSVCTILSDDPVVTPDKGSRHRPEPNTAQIPKHRDILGELHSIHLHHRSQPATFGLIHTTGPLVCRWQATVGANLGAFEETSNSWGKGEGGGLLTSHYITRTRKQK